VETLTSSELQLYISIDRGERHIMQHKKDKLSHWLLSSVGLPAILVPLLLVATGSIVTAQEFKPKQLIAQSCRNIEIRPQPRRNITLPKGTLRVTCGYKLRFQSDGNLVLADKSEKALWATGTEGRGERLVMQADGNLVIYDSGNKPLWATNTSGNPEAFFAIQGDGNLVIYKDGKALWASGTDRGQARTRSAASEWQQASQPQPSLPNQPSTASDYMGTYFKDGTIIRLSNVAGPVINLHFQENGGMINSWSQDPNDDDQKFRVSRNGGTNQIKLIRVNSFYLVSTKETFSDQALLEAWRDIGGFHPNQTWYVDAANTPGTFWLKPLGNSAYAMNLPDGGNNRKLTISNFNPNDPNQKFSVVALGIAPPPPPGGGGTPPPPPPNTQASKRKIDSFVNQFNGTRNIQRYDHPGDPGFQGQCVTLVIRYLQDHYGGSRSGMALGHGKDVAAGAGNKLSSSFFPINDPSDPIPGSIISFNKGDIYGHVALVVNSRRDGNLLRMTILESNGDNQALSGNSLVRLKDITVNASPPYATNYVGNASWVNPRD
jgi:surface antigen